jgi:hypothetical protein
MQLSDLLAQGGFGPVVEPFEAPCCGLVILSAAVAIAAVASLRWKNVEPAEDRTVGRRQRRRSLRHRVFWPAASIAVIVYIAMVLADIRSRSWAYRTRTTSIQLFNRSTGKSITNLPTDLTLSDVEALSASINLQLPGVIRVEWDRPCTVTFRVPGYSAAGEKRVVELDDQTPGVVQIQMDPNDAVQATQPSR